MKESSYYNEVIGGYAPGLHTTVRRLPERARYDRALVHEVLDEALVCHVGFAHDGRAFVIPTTFARIEETLYLHGSPASRMLRTMSAPVEVCVTVTLLDGLVLARSTFHHSMNYRSVVVLGRARRVEGVTEKRAALHALVEHVVPGRSDTAREPNDKELRATLVLALELDEVSAKVRTGGPLDDPADLDLPVWGGEIPLRLVRETPAPDATTLAQLGHNVAP